MLRVNHENSREAARTRDQCLGALTPPTAMAAVAVRLAAVPLANGSNHNAAEKRMGSTQWSALAAYLGFRIVYANGRTWRPSARLPVPAQALAIE